MSATADRRASGQGWRVAASLLLLSGFLLAPLGYPGYFQPHSGFQPVYTLYAWEAAGRPIDGLPASSLTGSAGGDGVLSYCLAFLFRLMGADGPSAVKAVYALAVLLAVGGALALFRGHRSGATGGSIALGLALAWAGSPMVLASIYVRGWPGGSLALGMLPWLALALAYPAPGGATSWRSVAPILPGLALGLAHPGFALIAGAVLAAVALVAHRRVNLRPLVGLLLTGTAGLIAAPGTASASFRQFSWPYQWLGHTAGYAAHSAPWGPGVPAPLTLGLLPVGLFAAACLLVQPGLRARCVVVGAVAVVLLLLSTELARPLWEGRLAWALDGPWQLVALASFVLLWASAPPVVQLLPTQALSGGALALLALLLALPFLDVPLSPVTPAARPLAAFDDGRILLVRAELHGPLRHGATPRLRLFWQATQPLERNYTVFVHVVDQADRKWGQRDSWPVDGTRPTTSWRPGEVVVDDHLVHVDLDGPREGYRVLVGLYDLGTGERLTLSDGTTAVELGRED
ncbi:MAG: hypothetical protein HPY83_12575 [Anaerolineae bacterium]|nr:hypothetical protein [Anaerolineae bacterium]